MRQIAVISILGVSATAFISALVLWLLMVDPSRLVTLGLVGVFSASLFGHLTVVAKDMFIPMYLPLTSIYHPLILGVTAGAGAALGEVTTYLLGWGIAETVRDEQNQKEGRLANWFKSYGLWAVLLVAVTPLPDTPLVLLAGSNRLPFGKLLLAECLGKMTLYSIGAVVGGFVFNGLIGIVGGLAASLITAVASILFCIMIAWGKGREKFFGWLDSLLL